MGKGLTIRSNCSDEIKSIVLRLLCKKTTVRAAYLSISRAASATSTPTASNHDPQQNPVSFHLIPPSYNGRDYTRRSSAYWWPKRRSTST